MGPVLTARRAAGKEKRLSLGKNGTQTHTQDINPQTCARYKYLLQISTCSNLVLHHALCLSGEEQYCIITLFKTQGNCQHCD